MSDTQQWADPCNGCEYSVEYHCNTCSLNFCPECKDKQNDSDETKHHLIVPYSERVISITDECKDHPGNVLKAWCDTCHCTVCIHCVTSASHKAHVFVSFQEKSRQKKEHFLEEFNKTKGLCSLWQESISDLETNEEELKKAFESIESEIKKEAEMLRRYVTNKEVNRLKQLQDNKQVCLQKINKQKSTLRENLDRFEQERNEYEEVLRSKDTVEILEFEPKQAHQKKIPPPTFIQPSIPLFKKGKSKDNVFDEMFGKLVFEKKMPENTKHFKNEETKEILQKTPLAPVSYTLATSIEGTHVVHTDWKDASPIVCIGYGQAWIATEKHKLKLMDKSSNVEQRIKSISTFCDAALTSRDDILLLNDTENCVRLFSSNGTLELFKLGLQPCGICSLHDDSIVITFRDDKKVIKYNHSGEKLVDFENVQWDHPLYVTQNKANKDIYITDKIGNGHYNCLGRVVAFKDNGEFLYEYTGHTDADFTPVDICSDEAGQIFITDYASSRVHILNMYGGFLRFLSVSGRELVNPCRIDINDSIYVWISENETKTVSVVRLI